MSTKIVIEPVTRVEGHGKITVQLNAAGDVDDVHLHVTQVRGFEKFCEGRLFWEMPAITARICGICPVSHQLASSKAGDAILGVKLTPTAESLRRLLHAAQYLQSHALHFFYLASPDLLLGPDSAPATRNVIALISARPEIVKTGVSIRSFGQKIIEMLGDKKVHPTAAIPGGMCKRLTFENREIIANGLDQVIAGAQTAIEIVKRFLLESDVETAAFASFASSYLGLVDAAGRVEYYDGRFRLTDSAGQTLEDEIPPEDYLSIIQEKVENWSYLKFPFYRKLGYPDGMYRVGPLARLNVCNGYSTPLANTEFLELSKMRQNGSIHGSLYYHLARMVEMLNAAEIIKTLIANPAICATDIFAAAKPQNEEGIGVIEAPRGTLIHHYVVDSGGTIRKANLIVATGHNNLAMNRAVSSVAREYIRGGKVTEGILNRLEVAIRCYDPCFSCSTHALGHLPLELEVLDANNTMRRIIRN